MVPKDDGVFWMSRKDLWQQSVPNLQLHFILIATEQEGYKLESFQWAMTDHMQSDQNACKAVAVQMPTKEDIQHSGASPIFMQNAETVQARRSNQSKRTYIEL